ncbi:aspartyl-tRNA(Asn)/glutamyl-tRNA(Gln) amidotransferase subunit A [Palleronia marisminoris]|uniref:Glutamyl-tRNA(Gln) amidotransferase subunit A n=1 Tax=Palleronia marisminoris TaxID=315423 RepID=A0A1Y5SL24_9RHOB|nr:amidase family protein [Palleronia marisminoris]SFG86852.1 aspartyl-tRNA(Asn)/glutamyl-tRNA(Gln) amidotransferase subunit A [Palleronia marisminoris]SLN42892.1 Glutamyl-tRNA(Gln) amidotransferase subunit A [Palleronia marisminoris]
MRDWTGKSAADLGRGIEAGRLDPVELAEAMLAAIDAHDLSSCIYARTTPDRARAEALAARKRARAGVRKGPLDGVPISWKDLYDTAGIATEAGSRLLEGRVPARDAAVLGRASAEGLVCLGKTHMSELAFSGLGLNPSTATPPCVNDAAAVSGGSSSGAAASVAFGLSAGAIGSDTGGSVRVPAAWNDLVGLKTTHGVLPMAGVVPLCPSFDTLGPLGRSVEDCALLFGAMGGRTPDLAGEPLAGKRFMVLETVAMEGLEGTVGAAFDDALDRLSRAGARIERREAPSVARAMPLSPTLFAAEAYGTWRDVIEAQPDLMFAQVRDRFRSGREISAADYVAARTLLDQLRADYLRETASYDAVLLPSCPILPPEKARLESEPDFYVERNLLTLRNTRIGNLMGLPGLTIPTGSPSVGLLLQTPPRTEARLLRIGRAVESALA